MSILTFPSLVGSTWDIKKRQFWSTDIETSASGVEFRTAYWTKPIYEFDMQFSYLSQADMVTLQAFYASMQGPFGTFCLNVPNDGPGFSPAVPVFTGDGSTTSVVLPSAVGYVTNVSAMHRTDWQGRQLLYSTPRTNWIKQSDNLSSAQWVGNPSKTLTATLYAGELPYYEIKKTTTSGSEVTGNYVGKSASPGDVIQLRIAMRAGTQTAGSVGILGNADTWGPNPNASAIIVSGPGAIAQYAGGLFIFTGLSAATDTVVLITRTIAVAEASLSAYLYPGTADSHTVGDSNLFTAAMLTINGGTMGAHISTTTAPVTVTDYTVSNAGVVTLGQAPASGAVVDADLNYGYLVRFRDDNASTAGAMEINQMMSGFYEQTGLTFRTVR